MPRSNHGPLSFEKARGKIRYAKMHRGQRWKSQTYYADSRENFREAWRDFCDWRDRQEENSRLEAKARETHEESVKREFIESAVIKRDIEMAYSGWRDQPNPELSAKKLRMTWRRWSETGRNPFDKKTWNHFGGEALEQITLADDFHFNRNEIDLLQPLSALLGGSQEQITKVVKHLLRLIRVHPEVPRTWIVQILERQGVKAHSKKLDKPKLMIDFLMNDLEWIFVAASHGVGRCRRFALGKTMRKKFQPLDFECWWEEPIHPLPYEEMLEWEMQLPVVVSCCNL